jgi:hypothetical protein
MSKAYQDTFNNAINVLRDCLWIWKRDETMDVEQLNKLTALVQSLKFEWDTACQRDRK